jgi:hypothetical protein
MISFRKCRTSKYLLGECGKTVQIARLVAGKLLLLLLVLFLK